MGEIPGYQITVERNGSPVNVTSGSVTREAGQLGPSWEVSLAQPLDISKSDTWTIKRKLAGYEETLVDEALASNIGGRDGTHQGTRKVTGAGNTDINNLLEYCVPKTMVFVNMAWARSLWPDAVIMNDILCYGSVYSSGVRITHPRLPNLDIDDDEFECIAGHDTHHKAARYLATLVGYELEANTPDIDIIDTFTIEAGTTWRDAIERNFRIWFPTIEVVEDRIIVSDICSANPDGVQEIQLTNDAIESASLNRHGFSDEHTLDHLIVTGRKTNNTEELYDEEPDFTPVKRTAIPLEVGKTITTSRNYTEALNHKEMGEYTGSFGLPDEAETKKNLKSESQETRFHVDETEGKKRYIPVGETIRTYDEDDTEVAKIEISYSYAKGFIPIKTVEEEYILCHMPGTESEQLHKLRTKTTLQDQFIKPLDLTLTTEIVEAVILYEEIEQDGTPYKVDPQIMADITRGDTTGDAVDTDPDTTQDTLEMTTNHRSTFINRTFDEILIKRDRDYNRLSGHVKTQSQILENPIREPEDLKGDNQFRAEYHPDGSGTEINGTTCYHAPKTVHHDDITTEAISDQIAERAFVRKDIDQNDEWTVDIPVPFLPQMVGTKIVLPDFQARVNGALVTVSGGDFMLRRASESFSFSGDGNQTDAQVKTSLTVRERY